MKKILTYSEVIEKIKNRQPLKVMMDEVDFGEYIYDEKQDAYVGFDRMQMSMLRRYFKNKEDWMMFYE